MGIVWGLFRWVKSKNMKSNYQTIYSKGTTILFHSNADESQSRQTTNT